MLRSAATMAILFALLAWPSTLLSRTWHIEPDGTGDAPTIQAGIDSAAVEDIVLLQDGIYTGPGNYRITYSGKSITVRSESDDPYSCIIDCQSHLPHTWRRGFLFISGEGPESVLRGIGITNGWSYASDGGAMRLAGSSPTFIRCRFFGNYSEGSGGAVGCTDGSPTFTDCVFENNSAEYYGGAAIFTNGSPSFIDCVFDGNSGRFRGGGFVGYNTNAVMEGCVFIGNHTSYEGGGAAFQGSSPVLIGCEFISNDSGHGGGLYFLQSMSSISSCVFRENSCLDGLGGGLMLKLVSETTVDSCRFEQNSAMKGGGIACWEGSSTPEIRDCIIDGNFAEYGGGILCKESLPKIIGSTIHGNESESGGGIYLQVGASPTIENTIIAFNYPGTAINCQDTTAGVTLVCSDLYGNEGGDWVDCYADQADTNGNFSADPLFCYPDTGNFYLDAASPCLPGNHPDGYDCGLIGTYGEGCDIYTSVAGGVSLPVRVLGLFVTPNPSKGDVSLRYSLPTASAVQIHIFDIRGRVVRSMQATHSTGILTWDGADASGRRVAPGVYFVRLSDGRSTETKRVTLVR